MGSLHMYVDGSPLLMAEVISTGQRSVKEVFEMMQIVSKHRAATHNAMRDFVIKSLDMYCPSGRGRIAIYQLVRWM
jgi:hypothetical protein